MGWHRLYVPQANSPSKKKPSESSMTKPARAPYKFIRTSSWVHHRGAQHTRGFFSFVSVRGRHRQGHSKTIGWRAAQCTVLWPTWLLNLHLPTPIQRTFTLFSPQPHIQITNPLFHAFCPWSFQNGHWSINFLSQPNCRPGGGGESAPLEFFSCTAHLVIYLGSPNLATFPNFSLRSDDVPCRYLPTKKTSP